MGMRRSSGWLPEEGIVNWITGKADNMWAGLWKAKGGWKVHSFSFSFLLGCISMLRCL